MGTRPRAVAGLPGGGLLYVASPLAFVAVLGALVLAVVLWWGISAQWAIPLVWTVAAALAVWLAGGPRLFTDRGATWGWSIPVVYGLAALAAGSAVVRHERTYRRKLAEVPQLNEYLSQARLPARSVAVLDPSDVDVELLRWAYDMALQPLDQFTGFDWGEQIHGPTCARYQLNMLGYALALYATNYVPNAPQPIERAMANLIDKATDLRVWGYWRTLNLIGNLDANPDPIIRDNIMLSAYLAEQINAYEAATGSHRFDEPDSLTFVWKDGRTFAYDHGRIVEAVRHNFECNELGFFPCEPGWVFTACNTQGAQALKGYDTLHGTDHWAEMEARWRRTVEGEMLTPDGNLPHIRSKTTGLSFDTGEVPGGEYFLTGTNGFFDVAPDLAVRGTLLALRGADARMGALRDRVVDGVLELDLEPRPERNTLIVTAVPEWTRLVAGARLVGDERLAQAALRRMEATCTTGQSWPERPLHAGVQTLGIHLLVRWATPLSSADLLLRGYRPPVGPVLADAPWTEVLATKARSADGTSLDLRLHPVGSTLAAIPLRFESLTPGAGYRLTGPGVDEAVQAGPDGGADVTIGLEGPADLRLERALAP